MEKGVDVNTQQQGKLKEAAMYRGIFKVVQLIQQVILQSRLAYCDTCLTDTSSVDELARNNVPTNC